MGRRIELPKTPSGEPEEQLRQLYSYLYQMAEALNSNLAEIGGSELTDLERSQIREVIGDGEYTPADERSEAETLKSLIIKTASFVQSSMTQYRTKLLGEYVAEGKFGKYVRITGLDVDVTPTGITQNYTLQEIIQGLKTYEVNAKNYIKTGYLRTENMIPVYGVAIGKDIVTFSTDGEETYHDGNKVAELTADELSFWQNEQKIASYKGNRISFYYNNAEVFYISAGKIYCVNDLELSTGKKLIITTENFSIDGNGNVDIRGDVQILGGKGLSVKTGGTFTVDSGNFSIDASGNVMLKGGAEIISGESLAVKAGGAFTVDSGNFSIDSSGNVVLKGTAEIIRLKAVTGITGGTVTLDSGYFSIDSSGNVVLKGTAEIISGNGLTVKTGGTFTIDSGNFSIDASGNVILKGGAEIISGESLSVKAGGAFTVDSGNFSIDASGNVTMKGTAEIVSGNGLTIKAGGTFTVDSGNLSIDSSGNVILKGEAEILSGKKLKIKSGGAMEVESGGDMKVLSGGAMEIQSGGGMSIESGGEIKIKSGSTFEVESDNIDINDTGLTVKKGILKGKHYTEDGIPLLTGSDIVISSTQPAGESGRIWINPLDAVSVNFTKDITAATAVNGYTGNLTTSGAHAASASSTHSYRLRMIIRAGTSSGNGIDVTIVVNNALTFTAHVPQGYYDAQDSYHGDTEVDITITNANWYGDQASLPISITATGYSVGQYQIQPGSIQLIASSAGSGGTGWKNCEIKVYQ